MRPTSCSAKSLGSRQHWGKKKAGAAREALGSLTELENYARGLGNCACVGSSLGALALLKRHFGLAIEVGRQGQVRPRRKSLMDRVAFLHPAPVHPVLVTRRKATLLLIQEKQPNAHRIHRMGQKLTCFHKGRLRRVTRTAPTAVGAATAPRRGAPHTHIT